MNKLTQDFISGENRVYKFKIGYLIASSLSGFLAGAFVASIIWLMVFRYL